MTGATALISDERLLAWLDGELAGADAAEVDAAVRADPALSERIASQGDLKASLAAAYAPILEEPIPERLLAAAEAAPADAPRVADVVSLADRRARRDPPAWAGALRRTGLPIAAGLALGLVLGAAGGLDLGQGPLVRDDEGALVAGRRLDRALETQLAAAQPTDAAVRVGLSFREADGTWCRTFEARADGSAPLAGLACREAEAWRVRLVMAAPVRPASEYRQAASETPEPILALVDQLAASAPADANAEAAARRTGWR